MTITDRKIVQMSRTFMDGRTTIASISGTIELDNPDKTRILSTISNQELYKANEAEITEMTADMEEQIWAEQKTLEERDSDNVVAPGPVDGEVAGENDEALGEDADDALFTMG